MNATIQTIPELLIQTRGNQTEVARMLSCARGTVLKYNRVTNGAIVIHTQRLKSDPGGNLLS